MKISTFLKTSVNVAAFVTLGFTVKAQITLTQSDMPQIGEAFQIANENSATVTPGAAGASQTWNFSSLNNGGLDTFAYVATNSTVYGTDYPGSNMAEVVKSGAFSVYGYINLSAGAFTTQGVVIPGFTIGMNTPSQIILTFPATYNSHWNSIFTSTNYYPNIQSGYDSTKEVQHVSIADTIDGWGSLTTPVTTYTNVLRLKVITNTITDSTYYRQSAAPHNWIFQVANAPQPASEDFYWYAKGVGAPVVTLSLDTVGKMVHSGTYLYKNITGIAQVSNSSSALVYPNPASTSINIVLKSANANGYIKIIDITGREIENSSFKNGKAQLNTSGYASGMYLYLMTDMNGILLDKGKFTVSH